MKKTSKVQLRRVYLFLFILNTLLFLQIGNAQNASENEKVVFANIADAEKIYLQLSGSSFTTSETIWFKAIVTDALTHRPTTKSRVLHVELIDAIDNRIIDKSLLKIENGLSDGFFQLHSSYREGKYIVRAYTEWNKNFGADFITSIPISIFGLHIDAKRSNLLKDIQVTENTATETFSISSAIALQELDSLHTGEATILFEWRTGKDSIILKSDKEAKEIEFQHTVPNDAPIIQYLIKTKNKEFTKSVVLDEDYGTLQFFPEGGGLVEGLQSVIGFKYLDFQGKGRKVQGAIVDEQGNKIRDFISNRLGMGRITLIPEAGKQYYGEIMGKGGETYRYELPKAKSSGLVLNVIQRNANKELRIWHKEKNNDSLFVKLHFRGKNLFLLKGRFKNGMFLHSFPDKSLPQGVVGLTVYDRQYSPLAERHFFNRLAEEDLRISLQTNESQYAIRDNVQVSIATQLKGQSVPASISVMAVDAAYYHSTNPEKNTILSYFLLESDIKGVIEDPSYYFENDKNLLELDYLMLTQGWTNYKYTEKPKPIAFRPERGLAVKGVVEVIQNRTTSNGQQVNSFGLNMLLMGESMEAYSQNTDPDGNFRFDLPDSYGLGRGFVLQPSDEGKLSRGYKINIKEHQSPEMTFDREKLIVPVDSIVEENITAKIAEDIRRDPFLYANAIALNEVVVSDYKVTPERAKMVELHGMPDLVIESKELLEKQKNWTNALYRWLKFNYPNELRIQRVNAGAGFEIATVNGAEWTYVVIDGIPVLQRDYRLIGNIPVKEVKSTEIIRNSTTANQYFLEVFDCAPACSPPAFPAILAIYTYSGNGLYGAFHRGKQTGLLEDTAPQFTPIREYYSPDYRDDSQIDWSIPDRRTLLTWQPNIVTGANGTAETTLFNSDLKGKMVLICEGITSDGKVGYTTLSYEVENP